MEHYVLSYGQWLPVESVKKIPEDAPQWIDFTRDENEWFKIVEEKTGIHVHENHVSDSLNSAHPPKFESSSDYEMLIMPSLIESNAEKLEFSSYTFLITEHLLITIRPEHCPQYSTALARLTRRKGRSPGTIPGLLYVILNALVNVQLNMRPKFTSQVEIWQERLIERDGKLGDWTAFSSLQRQLNRLISLCEMQWDTVEDWRSETELTLTEHQQIRFKDVLEHLRRLSNHLQSLRNDSENLLQIYFSSTQEKTNEIVRLLTIISVIFLPLNLVAGVFGMNFSKIPFLESGIAFWITLGVMAGIAIIVFLILKRVRWV